jgi:ketosteroid isomerase-like protein
MTTTQTNTPSTTLEERRRFTVALHEAGAAEDWDTVLAAYAPDIVWINDPGAGPWAGRFEGIDAVATMFTEYLAYLEGTFTQEIIDVCVSEDRAMTFLIERSAKNGFEFENRAVWIARFEGDKVVEVITVDLDRDDALAFWAAVADGSEPATR